MTYTHLVQENTCLQIVVHFVKDSMCWNLWQIHLQYWDGPLLKLFQQFVAQCEHLALFAYDCLQNLMLIHLLFTSHLTDASRLDGVVKQLELASGWVHSRLLQGFTVKSAMKKDLILLSNSMNRLNQWSELGYLSLVLVFGYWFFRAHLYNYMAITLISSKVAVLILMGKYSATRHHETYQLSDICW